MTKLNRSLTLGEFAIACGNEPPSLEALAQAREQLEAEGWKTDWIANFAAYAEQRALLNTERATVIELRRQLAEKDEDFEEGARERDALRTELATERRVLECAKAMLADMEEDRNTERQRLEESESDRRVQYCRADAAERLLATERQRAEAAERSRDEWRESSDIWERNRNDRCRERDTFERLYAASEAKRKALREALLDVGQIVIQMRIPTVEESAAGHDRALREKGEVHTIWTKALAADGKDGP